MGASTAGSRGLTRKRRRIDVRKAVADKIPARHYATHGWDKYPAKMVPHLARYSIERVSKQGDRILAPFCGCGTVQVESLLAKRCSIGLDINPVAVLLARAKSAIYDVDRLRGHADEVAASAASVAERRFDYPRWLDYCFTPLTLHKLLSLRTSIRQSAKDVPRLYRDLLYASLVVSVRHSSRADPRSPKPFISKRAREERVGRHYDSFRVFLASVDRLAQASADLFGRIDGSGRRARTLEADARCVAKHIRSDPVDAIVTSPPYLSAQDYYRSSKLELAILGRAFRHGRESLGERIIGSGRGGQARIDWGRQSWRPKPLEALRKSDDHAAAVVARYFDDMRAVFKGIHRVVKPGGLCCFIVGDSTLRGIRLPVHRWISEIAETAGFQLVEHEVDTIRDRRVPPQRQGHSSLIDCEHLLFFERSD